MNSEQQTTEGLRALQWIGATLIKGDTISNRGRILSLTSNENSNSSM